MIVVIAILASISIVAYRGIQDRAKATQIISMYNAIEKAFKLAAVEQGWTTWPRDSDITGVHNGAANVLVSTLAATANFAPYLQGSVVPEGSEFRYDNDADVYTNCSTETTGVSIYSRSDAAYVIPQAVAQIVDDSIDDGDLSCGKVIYDTTREEFKIFLSFGPDM